MSCLVTYFLEFQSEEKKAEYIAVCKRQIGWAWDIVGNHLLDSGRFLSFYMDDMEWQSRRWNADPWDMEYTRQPAKLYAVSKVDCHDALIAMANALCATGVVLSNFGFVKLQKDEKHGNRIERQYWSGGWPNARDPQTRLDIEQKYVLSMDSLITHDGAEEPIFRDLKDVAEAM